jgi:hypothetical protein
MTPTEWLQSGRDYEQGRQLYAVLGDNERLKRLFAQGSNSFNREAVAWELQKLARAGVAVPVVVPVPAPIAVPVVATALETVQKVDSSPEKVDSSTPEGGHLLAELRDAQWPLYDARRGIHMQLEGLPTDADRFEACRQIMALSRTVDANWDTIHYVEAHGELPPAPAAAPDLATLPRAELLAKRNNLRSQVSKLKRKPARAADLAQAQTDLAAVEALLKDE